MSIRHEDKEFIQSLSLLGALLGACIGCFMIMRLSDRANKLHAEQSEQQQTQAALIKLSNSTTTPNSPIASKEVLDQVQQQIRQDTIRSSDSPKSFWLKMPRWGLWSLCGVGGIAGAVSGFSAIWLTGWTGSLFLYQFIRLLYAVIRKVAPNSAAARETIPHPDENGSCYYQRNDKRFLPVIVKLFFFLVLSLALLTLVVWHLTSL
jgi:hypothetical protein